MVSNWQHLCQKLYVTAEVALNDFIGMDNDVIVVQGVTKDDDIMFEMFRLVSEVAENDKEEDNNVTLSLSLGCKVFAIS
jgi:hypothetical protein